MCFYLECKLFNQLIHNVLKFYYSRLLQRYQFQTCTPEKMIDAYLICLFSFVCLYTDIKSSYCRNQDGEECQKHGKGIVREEAYDASMHSSRLTAASSLKQEWSKVTLLVSCLRLILCCKDTLEVLSGCINNNFLQLQYIHFTFLCLFILCKVVADATHVVLANAVYVRFL